MITILLVRNPFEEILVVGFIMTNIYTNAIDLAKKIQELNGRGISYEISIVNGIGKEQVVKLSWVEEFED